MTMACSCHPTRGLGRIVLARKFRNFRKGERIDRRRQSPLGPSLKQNMQNLIGNGRNEKISAFTIFYGKEHW